MTTVASFTPYYGPIISHSPPSTAAHDILRRLSWAADITPTCLPHTRARTRSTTCAPQP